MKRMMLSIIMAVTAMFLITSCDKAKGPFGDLMKGPPGLEKVSAAQSTDFDKSKEFEAIVYTPGGELSVPLLAGKHHEVGVVTVEQVGDNHLKIAFKITNKAWGSIKEAHLSVTGTLEEVPGWPGNPKIGLFNRNKGFETDIPYEYLVPIPTNLTTNLVYILAHAVVEDYSNFLGYTETPDLEAFRQSLPLTVVEKITSTLNDNPRLSYNKTLITEGGILNGTYGSWCVNTAYSTSGSPFTAKVFSSYDPSLPAGLVDKPANFDKVNWLLNQNFLSEGFTMADIQVAIWSLLDDIKIENGVINDNPLFDYPYLGDWSQDRVDHVLAKAEEFGKGFIPGCGESIVLVFQPINPTTGEFINKQPTIIEYPLPCKPIYGDETAWALGYAFPGNSWAMYFTYKVVN